MTHKKDFDKWNEKKKILDKKKGIRYFNEREVWFINLGLNIGYEQDGKGDQYLRSVLIFKKFNSRIFLGIPLTTNIKNGKYYYSFNFKNKNITAILSQIRLFDSKRLATSKKYGKLSNNDFKMISEKLNNLIFLKS